MLDYLVIDMFRSIFNHRCIDTDRMGGAVNLREIPPFQNCDDREQLSFSLNAVNILNKPGVPKLFWECPCYYTNKF